MFASVGIIFNVKYMKIYLSDIILSHQQLNINIHSPGL